MCQIISRHAGHSCTAAFERVASHAVVQRKRELRTYTASAVPTVGTGSVGWSGAVDLQCDGLDQASDGFDGDGWRDEVLDFDNRVCYSLEACCILEMFCRDETATESLRVTDGWGRKLVRKSSEQLNVAKVETHEQSHLQ